MPHICIRDTLWLPVIVFPDRGAVLARLGNNPTPPPPSELTSEQIPPSRYPAGSRLENVPCPEIIPDALVAFLYHERRSGALARVGWPQSGVRDQGIQGESRVRTMRTFVKTRAKPQIQRQAEGIKWTQLGASHGNFIGLGVSGQLLDVPIGRNQDEEVFFFFFHIVCRLGSADRRRGLVRRILPDGEGPWGG